MNIQRTWLIGAAVCGFFAAGGHAGSPTAGATPRPKKPEAGIHITSVSVRGVKTKASERCPATIHLAGGIATNGATHVKYAWETSRGRLPEESLEFEEAVTKGVTYDWKVGAPGQHVDDWIQLMALSPTAKESRRIKIAFRCDK